MANVTCVKLILWGEPKIVEHLEEHSQFHFLIDENGRASDRFVSSLDSYSGSIPTPGRDALMQLVNTFKYAPFDHPEYAVLVISDDDSEDLDGAHRPIGF
ncbi:MAG: hypothetical protein GY774_23165 [Planctomycetes bacterium]|nr:hypothetical protein [Planctomycetota bacterium]